MIVTFIAVYRSARSLAATSQPILSLVTLTILSTGCTPHQQTVVAASPQTPNQWYETGRLSVAKNRELAGQTADNAERTAKNIILFVGDGMGVSTVTASRIYAGQQQGGAGEEHLLFFETLPYLALAKTYNTNQQTPDSAGTMTAMMSGVKTKAGVIGVSQSVTRGDCSTLPGNIVTTALEHAEQIGMSTGIVTTARLTHATPAATYAHVPERGFENDQDAALLTEAAGCKDIADQLVTLKQRYGNGLEVALGGGRRNFITNLPGADPDGGGIGARHDGRDLPIEWLATHENAAYAWNKQQLARIRPETTDHVLGLFAMSHMAFELDRQTTRTREPSLTEMTAKAIQILQKNPKGFFLQVEAGRIDHAHHAGNAIRALTDTLEFSRAIEQAYNMTDPADTLLIVTADHSHVFTIAGYPTRGNPILGKVIGNDRAGNPKTTYELAQDNLPYTTLGYMNGHTAGAIFAEPNDPDRRADLTTIDTEHESFHQQFLVPLESETHSGEDVAVYASGPGAALIQGTLEQHTIFHVMDAAGRLSERSGLPVFK